MPSRDFNLDVTVEFDLDDGQFVLMTQMGGARIIIGRIPSGMNKEVLAGLRSLVVHPVAAREAEDRPARDARIREEMLARYRGGLLPVDHPGRTTPLARDPEEMARS
jgi:hypothetical protein